jgi:hypothetical protein
VQRAKKSCSHPGCSDLTDQYSEKEQHSRKAFGRERNANDQYRWLYKAQRLRISL